MNALEMEAIKGKITINNMERSSWICLKSAFEERRCDVDTEH